MNQRFETIGQKALLSESERDDQTAARTLINMARLLSLFQFPESPDLNEQTTLRILLQD